MFTISMFRGVIVESKPAITSIFYEILTNKHRIAGTCNYPLLACARMREQGVM